MDCSDAEEADVPQCRICYDYENESENNEDLVSPCSCIGSLRYVHASCLNRWRALNIENKNRNMCQLCCKPYEILGDRGTFLLFKYFTSDPLKGEISSFLTKQCIYNWFVRTLSVLFLAPLALATSGVSQIGTRRNQVKIAAQTEQLWDNHTFSVIFGKGIVTEVNKLIESKSNADCIPKVTWRAAMVYGLTKLGYYGCTWWLFSDGLSESLPQHINARINRSSFLVLLKALVEFYLIPCCLVTPSSRRRLLVYSTATIIGILFILKKVENKIRTITIKLFPSFEEFELGRYTEH